MLKIYQKTLEQPKVKELKDITENTWINLVNPTAEEIKKVTSKVQIDYHLLKELLVEKDLPRIKKTKDATLIVLDIPSKNINNKKGYNTYPLGIIICNDLHIITVSLKEVSFLKQFINNEIEDFYTSMKSRFIIQIIGMISKEYLSLITKIEQYIETKEEKLAKTTSNDQLIDLLSVEKTLVYFITSLKYNNTVLEKISKEYVIDIYENDREYLEDTIIDNKQSLEMCNIYREILSSTIETYGTIISNNLNIAMRFLASITIVFSIPTMVASFLGMNVPLGFLATNQHAFFIIFIFSIIISICIAIWLKKKKLF